jgi:hypothetical protein
MNLTIDQYILGLERSVRELPDVLAEWDELEDELREEYAAQLLWLLRVRADVGMRAVHEKRFLELENRIGTATAALFNMRQDLREKMGITTDCLVPRLSYTATDPPEHPVAMAVGCTRLVSFIASEGLAIDQLTSRVTAFNMIDHVMLPGLPAVFLRLCALSFYELGETPESFLERVSLPNPQGVAVGISVSLVALGARLPAQLPNGHRSIHILWSTKMDDVGDYHLALEHRPWTAPKRTGYEQPLCASRPSSKYIRS